ncbi:MAG TPA: hypothetical protein VNZ52_08395 [Candidatus Thermoplasmatota archaeon]|nr:hypothetical protein [Candidatus Thermoplasmatota archaeon]
MGLFKWILIGLGLVVLLTAGTGAYLYFSDYAAEATVTEKGTDDSGQRYVIVTPKLYPYPVKVSVSSQEYEVICKDYFVLYRIQSGHTQVYSREGGSLIYETGRGIVDTGAAARCALTGSA